ncbi:transcriptional regulator [Bacillus phage vB_Bacillus_1020A]|nr:transcriptional regulator [Bacillus phage vB_Bacillus_1020A]
MMPFFSAQYVILLLNICLHLLMYKHSIYF